VRSSHLKWMVLGTVGVFLVISLAAFWQDSDWPAPSSHTQKSTISTTGCGASSVVGGISPLGAPPPCNEGPCAPDTACYQMKMPIAQYWEELGIYEPYQCCPSCVGVKTLFKITCSGCPCQRSGGSECPQTYACADGKAWMISCANCCEPCAEAGTPSTIGGGVTSCSMPGCYIQNPVPGDCGGMEWVERHSNPPVTIYPCYCQ